MGEVSDGLQAVLAAIQSQQQSIERLVRLLEEREELAESAPKTPPEKAKDAPGTAEEKPPGRTRIIWSQISGEQRTAAWYGLADFVEGLVKRYNMHLELRPCWWQHTDAVEELTALWHAWNFFFIEENNLNAPLMWRMQFNGGRDRVRDMFQSCRDSHVDLSVRTWMRPEVREAFNRMVEADVLAFEPPPPPAQRAIAEASPPAPRRQVWSDTMDDTD
jgi:hypothetical protein